MRPVEYEAAHEVVDKELLVVSNYIQWSIKSIAALIEWGL
jgi:hypothetical protein